MTSSIHSADQRDRKTGLSDLRPVIDAALENACDFGPGCPESLAEAIRYAVLAPGKRLRPSLVLMAAEACGGSQADALPGAVAIEMIHAYSLVHDDLPAMDDDDLRRGRPTTHVRFGEATAILAGDALQPEAIAHLVRHVAHPPMAVEAVRVLTEAAGASRLVGGQADDLAAEVGGPKTLEHLESIHRRKTGALITASVELGAVLSRAEPEKRKLLVDFSADLGLAFQIVDDLLDFTAKESALGKRAGKDADRGKLTYPGLLGIEAARQKADKLVKSARHHASLLGPAAWRLETLAGYVLERSN